MNQLDILLPFSLPPSDLAKDLLQQCKAPSLACLLARAKPLCSENFDAFSRALPHETWLERKFLPSHAAAQNSPAVADVLMRKHGLQAESGTWFVVQPVHFHIARDHLVLTDLRQLALSDAESRQLFDTAEPLFTEAGKILIYGDAMTWFVQADDWHDLHTATPDAACGHNIDIWLPRGNAELAWRKLQNEVQMHWHTHAVNVAREERGRKPVNSLWLWGGATLPHSAHSAQPAPAYSDTYQLEGWAAALGGPHVPNHDRCQVTDVIRAQPRHGLIVLDNLQAPAMAADWGTWLQQWELLDTHWCAAVLAAIQGGKLQRANLILTNNTALVEFTISRMSLHKFWIKPSLSRLLP